jgi:hypothetical protein
MSDSIDLNTLQTVPIKLVPELPLSNSSAFDIVAVLNNKDTVRVSWQSLTSNHIAQTADIPTEPGTTNDIAYITFAADETGIYTNDSTSWTKSPVYNNNWEDLTVDTRFLLVNAPMQLGEDEVANARQSLSLDKATEDKLGLVKVLPTTATTATANSVKLDKDGLVVVDFATPTSEENPEGVPGVVKLKNYYNSKVTEDGTYAVTETYVREAIRNYADTTTLPIATNSSLGVVVVDTNSALTISESGTLSVKTASSENTGVVFLDEATDIDSAVDSHAASVGLVNKIVAKQAKTIQNKIAGADLGMVRVPGSTAVTIDAVGNVDVRVASETSPGVVTVLGHLEGDYDYSNTDTGSTAVTPQAVTDYVEDKLANLSQSLPIATVEELGAVRVGSSVSVDPDTGVLDIKNATPTRLGGVYVSLAENDTATSTVPTEARVFEMLGGSTVSVSPAKVNKYGTVKLSTDVVLDGAKIGINSEGQLVAEKQVAVGPDGESSVAGYNSLGLVALSSTNIVSNTSNKPGLPIGASASGMLYVDVNSSLATTNKAGLVRLSVPSGTLNSSDPGVGVDENGRLRVNISSASGGTATSYYMYETSKPSEPVNIYYYKEGAFNYPFVYTASASNKGVVMLGTDTIIKGGTAVGVDDSGRLCVALSLGGGSSGETGVKLGLATSTSEGLVKVSQDTIIDGGLPIGFNANNQLTVASSSTNMTTATDSLVGGVKLSYYGTYQSDYGRIGLNNDNQIVVSPATYSTPGVVKIAGSTFDVSDNYTLVGRSPDGALAVKATAGGSSSGGSMEVSAPLTVKLVEKDGVAGYVVTMTGGFVQMNDGSLVKVEAVTEEDNVVIDPVAGQMLKLKVYINEDREAVAKLQLTSDTKVLTCKPLLV